MKPVLQGLYSEPVLFLAVIQAAATALAASGVITGWIPLVTLAILTVIQRSYVSSNQVGKA